MDRRKQPRCSVQLEVSFLYRNRESLWEGRAGVTRDVNGFGAFVFTEEPPPSGTAVALYVKLSQLGGTRSNWAVGRGQVVRAELSGDDCRAGFAAAADFIERKHDSI